VVHQVRLDRVPVGIQHDRPVSQALARGVGDGEPFPQINELGFEHTTLVHDGITSRLPPSEAYFYTLWSPWNLFFLDPNQGYGAGNYFQQSRGSNDGG
jgi:hypothetical protein